VKELDQKVDNLNQKVNKIIITSLQFTCKDSKRHVIPVMFKSNIVGLQNTQGIPIHDFQEQNTVFHLSSIHCKHRIDVIKRRL